MLYLYLIMNRPEKILEEQLIEKIEEIYADSGLGRWFGKGGVGSSSGGGWDRYDSTGKKAGKCGDAKKGTSYSAGSRVFLLQNALRYTTTTTI